MHLKRIKGESRRERKERKRELAREITEAEALVREAQATLKLAYFAPGTSRQAYLGSWGGAAYALTTKRREPISGSDITGDCWDLSVRGCAGEILAHRDQLEQSLQRVATRTPHSIIAKRR